MTTLVCSPPEDKKKYIFMPHRETLEEALKEKTEFDNLFDLEEILGANIFDISTSYYGFDNRIDRERFIVSISLYGELAVVGWYHFKDKKDELKWRISM